MSTYDTIFLGSSPNALIAAAYLARAHQRVLVLESSDQIGGGTVSTAEFGDGFHGDLGLTSGRLNPNVIKELQLDRHGLEMIERDTISSLLADGRSFTLSRNIDQAAKTIGGFSQNDGVNFKKFMHLMNLAKDWLYYVHTITPPGAHPDAGDAVNLAALVGMLRGYGRREMTEVMRLLVMPVRDMLDEWFEHPALKGLLAGTAVRGLTQGPFAGGTTFNLLHHLAIGDGYFRATAKGGMGAISRALAEAAKSHGAELCTNVGIARVVVIDGIACGVVLEGNERIDASKIVSDYDARHTFTHLIEPFELEPEFNRAVQNIRYNGAVARINLALSDLPNFTGLSKEALQGTLTVAPSVAYLEQAFDVAKHGGISHPYIEATIPTLSDPTLAPPGKHVMSLWLQYAPYKGKLEPERILEAAMSKMSEFAPNLRSLVLHSQILTPQDFESRFHLSEGHLYGGDMTLAQAFFLRPIPGFAQYRTPIEQLYLCGAATHPGGGVSGLAGVNVANELGLKSMAISV